MHTGKRQFLKGLGAGVLGLPALARAFGGEGAPRPTKNWVWITPETDRSADAWKRELALLRQSGVNAVVAEIYDGRHAYFASRRLPVKDGLLERILPLAHAAGLELHAWMWAMPCLIEDVLKKHPDWYSVNARGESAAEKPAYVDYYRFLDPARPEVREFVRDTVRELAAIAELDGVHLDYIRHPDAILPKGLWSRYGVVQDRVHPQFDYGYSPYSREQFKKRHGVDPLSLRTPGDQEAWLQYRLDSVSELVNEYLVPAAHEKGKTITAAVFPGPSLARQMVRQDWSRWKLDAFLPMLYHFFYEQPPGWVEAMTREAVAAVTAPVYSGLYVPPLDAAELRRTIDAALAGGAAGISIFSAAAMTPERWAVLKAAVGAGPR